MELLVRNNGKVGGYLFYLDINKILVFLVGWYYLESGLVWYILRFLFCINDL